MSTACFPCFLVATLFSIPYIFQCDARSACGAADLDCARRLMHILTRAYSYAHRLSVPLLLARSSPTIHTYVAMLCSTRVDCILPCSGCFTNQVSPYNIHIHIYCTQHLVALTLHLSCTPFFLAASSRPRCCPCTSFNADVVH